jgi:hypothetical protein
MTHANNPPKDASQSGSGALAQGNDARAVGQQGVMANNVGGSINTGTQIIHNYLAGGQARDPIQLEAHVRSYLRWVQARHGHVELRGIERGGRKVLTLDLDKALTVAFSRSASTANPSTCPSARLLMVEITAIPKEPKNQERVREAVQYQ